MARINNLKKKKSLLKKIKREGSGNSRTSHKVFLIVCGQRKTLQSVQELLRLFLLKSIRRRTHESKMSKSLALVADFSIAKKGELNSWLARNRQKQKGTIG